MHSSVCRCDLYESDFFSGDGKTTVCLWNYTGAAVDFICAAAADPELFLAIWRNDLGTADHRSYHDGGICKPFNHNSETRRKSKVNALNDEKRESVLCCESSGKSLS